MKATALRAGNPFGNPGPGLGLPGQPRIPRVRRAVCLLLLAGLLAAQYVELGPGGTLLMNVPYCGG